LSFKHLFSDFVVSLIQRKIFFSFHKCFIKPIQPPLD